jgi:hypothetical protein
MDHPAANEVQPPDWANVPESIARLILEQGERHLSAQLSSGLASDQRSMTAAAILIGFAAALAGAGIAASNDTSILVASLVGGVVMLVGAGMCAYAARPTNFYFPGNHPNRWWPVANETVSTLIGGETENYQWMISENEKVLSRNGKWLERGLILSSLAPVIGVLVWFSVSSLSSPAAAFPALSPQAYFVLE